MPTARRTAIETLTNEEKSFLFPSIQPAALPSDSESNGRPTEPNRPRVRRAAKSTSHESPKTRSSHLPSPSRKVKASRVTARQSVSVRLSEPLARVLRRASIERSLEYIEPFSQQGIVEAALSDWLRGNGYSIDS